MIYKVNASKYALLILAAGKSGRMGEPKFGLKFNETTTFLENIISVFNENACAEIVIVVNEEVQKLLLNQSYTFPQTTKIIVNKHPEWGRFYSVKIGLQQLENTQAVFLVNVDNPFVNSNLINALLDEKDAADFMVPSYKGKGGHPILLTQKVIDKIVHEENIESNLKLFLLKFNKKFLEVTDPNVLANINTPEEFLQYFGS